MTVSNLPSWIENLQGVGYAYSNYAHLLLNAAGVSVGGAAWSPTCGQDCNAGTNEGVLTSYTPGTVNVSNEEHLFQVVMRRAGGQDIPAGDVYVSAGTVAWAGQSNGPGDDSARVEAMVKGISVD